VAIARLKFPTRRDALRSADAAQKLDRSGRIEREVRRAADRPSLMAELTLEEMETLYQSRGQFAPTVRVAITRATEESRMARLAEQARGRGAYKARKGRDQDGTAGR
jgi:hypothetical protein